MFRNRWVGTILLMGWMVVCLTELCHAADPSLPRVVTHDNHTPAGVMRDGVLTLHLDIRKADWYPEAENGPHITVYAFGEAGKAPMVPGPLVRVPSGTKIELTVQNTLGVPIDVHGFFTRPGKDEAVKLAPDEQREFHFEAGKPGTYYYWAADSKSTIGGNDQRRDEDTQLSGALIVDEPGSTRHDRVFVIGLYRVSPPDWEFGTINGKAWPHTERFRFPLGDSVQWRWINATGSIHPMHLHGAYYRVDATGNGERDQRLAMDQRPMVVTENMPAGGTMDMTWKPDRPGHWLFHCHIIAHILPESSLSAIQKAKTDHHGTSGMSGLVVATEVTGPAKIQRASYREPRRLTLVVNEIVPRKEMKLELREGKNTSSSTGLMGPPIVLYRGQPAEIKVVNRLAEPTAIHWHGMELESYYDGVPDYSGVGKQVTPAIAPGGSFVARMTPPRAGTFIYHTHWHDADQLNEGLYGPLIVLEPGQRLQTESDVPIVASLTTKDEDGPLLINGSDKPEVTVRAGKVRLRLINITPNNTALIYTLKAGDKKLKWRRLAKDGMELSEAQKSECESAQQVGVGETYDFEISATAGEDLTIEGFLPGPKLKTIAPIHVH